MVEISGKTQLIAHLGVPTGGFKAPMIYNPWFRHAGVDVVVVPMACEPADYPDFLKLVFRLRNCIGALVTMPHKTTTPGLLDRMTPAVEIGGACNAVRRGADGALEGDMFDGEGFVGGMRRKGRRIEGAAALIVGAGGVGSAIAASLAAAGIAKLGLFDLDAGRADGLASRIRQSYPEIEIETGRNDARGFDIVVNATPLGMMADDPFPLEFANLSPAAFVGEVVMATADTPFLAAARAKGCDVQVGLDMNFEQIPAYLDFFGLPSTTPDILRQHARISI